MTTYAEFRILASPDVAVPGNWLVEVQDCPVRELVGPKGSVTPAFTQTELATLRNRGGWPNPAVLRDIGTAVWSSLMTPGAEAAFHASLASVRQSQRGLRIVLVVQGDESLDVANGGAVRLAELPVEALFSNATQFLATDLMTPISRSFQQQADRDPEQVQLPLRVLVAVAAPSDKPPAQIDDEITAIRSAVAAQSGSGGSIDLDVLEQATRQDFVAKLKEKPYRVVHFIGHGGFDTVGGVPTPRPHLCFVRADGSGLSDPTDSDTLNGLLRNTRANLVIITACASAAPTPSVPGILDAGPLGTAAFEGMAQRLVVGASPVNAAVAMQFDIESPAAIAFSKAFYENLVRPGIALDEVVTLSREAVLAELTAGHRAWVTPTVYWRSKDGRLFDIEASREDLDDATLARVHDLSIELDFHRAQVDKIAAKPPDERVALAGFRAEHIADVERLQGELSEIFGESLRLRGGRVAAGEEISCRLSLRSRRPGRLDLVRLRVEYPANLLSFEGVQPGVDAASPPVAGAADGVIDVVTTDPGSGASWQPREYELGFLRFLVAANAQSSIVELKASAPQVIRDGSAAAFKLLDAVVFIEG